MIINNYYFKKTKHNFFIFKNDDVSSKDEIMDFCQKKKMRLWMTNVNLKRHEQQKIKKIYKVRTSK